MAPLYLGSTAISKVYKGSTELAQNYLGDNALLSSGPVVTLQQGASNYFAINSTTAACNWFLSLCGAVQPSK